MGTARTALAVPVILALGSFAVAGGAAPSTRPATGGNSSAVAPVAAAPSPAALALLNALTDRERADGWVLLFDGKSTAGWRMLGGGPAAPDVWTVRDGLLVHLPTKTFSRDLIFEKPVESFELSWEWRVPKPNGNSGVKYRVEETPGKGGAFGPEYQMMADGDKADKDATGSLYDVLPPADKKLAPAGEFNASRIVVRGNRAEHWLNGRRTVSFEFWDEAFTKAVAQSKFKASKTWARNPKGFIALTDHADEAHFRNIKLRELK